MYACRLSAGQRALASPRTGLTLDTSAQGLGSPLPTSAPGLCYPSAAHGAKAHSVELCENMSGFVCPTCRAGS